MAGGRGWDCAVCVGVHKQLRFFTASRGCKKDPQGGAVRWSRVVRAGGWRCCCSRPRMSPSHCAGVMRAAGGRVWWAPEVKVNGRSPTGSTARGWASRRAEGCGPRRFGFVSVPHGAELRCQVAVLLVVAGVLGPSPHLRRKRNQPDLAESSRIIVAGHRFRPAGHRQLGLVGQAPQMRRGTQDKPHSWCEGSTEPRGRLGQKRADA